MVGRFDSPYGFVELQGKGNRGFKAPRSFDGIRPVDSVAVGRINSDKGPDVALGTVGSVEVYINNP